MFGIRKKCFLSAEIVTSQYSNVDITDRSFFYYLRRLRIHQFGTQPVLLHISILDRHCQLLMFVCDFCRTGNSFTTKRNLTIHSRRHTGEHLYSCSQCEKSFSSPSSLRDHKNIIQVNTSAQNVADVVRAVMSWQYTDEVIPDINHLNVLFVANDSQHQVTLLNTAEFTVERNRTNVTCVTRRLVRLDV